MFWSLYPLKHSKTIIFLKDQFIEKSAFPETIAFSGPFSRRLNSQKAVENVSTRFQAKFEIWKGCDQRLHNFSIFGMHWSRGWSRMHKRAEEHCNLDEFHLLNLKSLIFFWKSWKSFIYRRWVNAWAPLVYSRAPQWQLGTRIEIQLMWLTVCGILYTVYNPKVMGYKLYYLADI